MKRLVLVGGAAVGGALLVRRAISRVHGVDFEKVIERMPENAPPKWMFRNISAIRKNTEHSRRNTERILELLESERAPAPGEHVRTAA